jgi:hypothetical protein
VSGSGGSGGAAGTNVGGAYGGGGRGAAGGEISGSAGAAGAARIIWGSGRSYPSTRTEDETGGGGGPFIVWNASSIGTDNNITTSDKDIEIGDILFLTSIGNYARDMTMVNFYDWSELYYRFEWPTISIIYKVVDTTDDFTQVIFGESGIASRVAFCVRGADLGQMSSTNKLIDDNSILAVTLDAATGQLNPPSISVTNNSTLIIGIGATLGTTIDSTAATPPSGWTKNWGYLLAPGNFDSHSHLGGSIVVNSGTYDPPAWTGASDSWDAQYTLALAPL